MPVNPGVADALSDDALKTIHETAETAAREAHFAGRDHIAIGRARLQSWRESLTPIVERLLAERDDQIAELKVQVEQARMEPSGGFMLANAQADAYVTEATRLRGRAPAERV
jgi:hypothetical protein